MPTSPKALVSKLFSIPFADGIVTWLIDCITLLVIYFSQVVEYNSKCYSMWPLVPRF